VKCIAEGSVPDQERIAHDAQQGIERGAQGAGGGGEGVDGVRQGAGGSAQGAEVGGEGEARHIHIYTQTLSLHC